MHFSTYASASLLALAATLVSLPALAATLVSVSIPQSGASPALCPLLIPSPAPILALALIPDPALSPPPAVAPTPPPSSPHPRARSGRAGRARAFLALAPLPCEGSTNFWIPVRWDGGGA